MPVRSCRVTIQDMDGVSHTVEVTAATLYVVLDAHIRDGHLDDVEPLSYPSDPLVPANRREPLRYVLRSAVSVQIHTTFRER